MTKNNEKEQSKLRVKDIARPKSVIHPALDWVNGQLVVGVVFENGDRAALTSKDGLVEIEKIGNVCERDGKFESPVTPEMAEPFITYLETNPTSYPREDLKALLLELAAYFNQFVVFPERYWSHVMASWTLGTYLYPMFQAYPYLWLTSPAPGCGKSLLGHILANLSFNGEFMASPTEANMFHLVFTVLGAVAELERSLIVERVRAGLRNARGKGKQLGRPKKILDTKRIATLRAQGVGWKRIAAELGVGVGTLYRIAQDGSKIREKVSEP